MVSFAVRVSLGVIWCQDVIFVRVSFGVIGCQWVSTGVNGCHLVSGCQRVSFGVRVSLVVIWCHVVSGCQWVSLGVIGCLSFHWVIHWCHWVSIAAIGCQGVYWCQWVPLGVNGTIDPPSFSAFGITQPHFLLFMRDFQMLCSSVSFKSLALSSEGGVVQPPA